MFESVVTIFVYALEFYALAGLLFAAWFVSLGVTRVDSHARGTSAGFRLLILPGVAAFWPMFVLRLARGISEPPEERTPHR